MATTVEQQTFIGTRAQVDAQSKALGNLLFADNGDGTADIFIDSSTTTRMISKGAKGDPGPKGDKGDKGDPGSTGTQGIPGKSAYELDVENGYTGTLEDWLSQHPRIIAVEEYPEPEYIIPGVFYARTSEGTNG